MDTRQGEAEPREPVHGPVVAAVLAACADRRLDRIVLAVPDCSVTGVIDRHALPPSVRSVVVTASSQARGFPGKQLGRFRPERFSWTLPRRSAVTIAYAGMARSVSSRMLLHALGRGAIRIIAFERGSWRMRGIPTLLAERVARRLRRTRVPSTEIVSDGAPSGNAAPAIGPIVLVTGSLGPGGAERQVVNTAVGLAAAGYPDVRVLRLNSGGTADFYLPTLLQAGIAAEILPAAPAATDLGPPEQEAAFLSFVTGGGQCGDAGGAALLAICDSLPADVLHDIARIGAALLEMQPVPRIVHCWQDSVNIAGGFAARLAGVPSVLLGTRNMRATQFGYGRPHLRDAYRVLLADDRIGAINNSRAGRDDYADWLDIPSGRFDVVLNGLDSESLSDSDGSRGARALRSALAIPAGANLVGGIFRFWPEKRPLLWVDAARVVVDAGIDAHFCLMGDGPLRGEIQARIRDHGLEPRFHLLPPGKDVAAFLAALDVCLLTSRLEGLPNVLIEAQAMAVPVVASEAGGVGEAMIDGETGFLVNDEPAALGGAVVRLLRDPGAARAMGQAGRQFARSAFSVEQMVSATVAAYAARSPRCCTSAQDVDDEGAA